MKKILAISGGIDSSVLLHTMKSAPSATVAHFNHGTRPSADTDEAFVKSLAKKYHLPFISKKASLGPTCSESTARTHRYAFLKSLGGEIYTAHHQDDLAESIAINILRGTGWRGLAPLDTPGIHRPLLHLTKKDIFIYAAKHHLTFRQDPTNNSEDYLRNRLRPHLTPDPRLIALYQSQPRLKAHLDSGIKSLLPPAPPYHRAPFAALPDPVALELLRALTQRHHHHLTRPQLTNFLTAIRTYPPAKKFNLPQNHFALIQKLTFTI
jgi:tRNA(Ile)-lysidine synthase